MWVARVFQVVGLLFAIGAVLAVTFVSLNFPVQETDSQANSVVGMAYIVIVAPIALLYLLVGATSTLFLLPEKRRTAYGFNAGPWRSVFWSNLVALLVIVGLPLLFALATSLFILGS
ncbi:MAG: hypothetical protein JJU03_00480 [Idiomarina sp.]|nr:hypothetical protein [Idiomarina sp.]